MDVASDKIVKIAAQTPIRLSVTVESWPIRGGFTISRGVKHEADVVVAELRQGDAAGRGECVPYARYGESIAGVRAVIEAMAPRLADGLSRDALQTLMPPGAARNALDCAFWDLEAKQAGRSAAALCGLAPLHKVQTAFTISLGAPEQMAAAAKAAEAYPLLKLKLGGDGDAARLAAVRQAVPQARLIADANEAWMPSLLAPLMAAAAEARVELIEQPLPAGDDAALSSLSHRVPVCADESAHDRHGIEELAGRYEAVNIKLDKTGGLTEALATLQAAKACGLKIMVGSMVATSLSMAPAMLVAQEADWVDLDGPLLLARDREPGLRYAGGMVYPAAPDLWG